MRRLVSVGAVCVMAVALPACAESSGSAEDGPVYESIEALTVEAEVVVLGTVGAERGTEEDDGGNDDGPGIEVTFTSVLVDEVLAGRATTVQAGETLAVEASTELSEGDQMVLFLEELTPAEAPGIDTEELFYVIIGVQDNGAFDVQDGAVTARSEHVRGLATASSEADEPFTTSLDDLRAYFSER